MSKLPKTWQEWDTLMSNLFSLSQPVTMESIKKYIQSLGYDYDALANSVAMGQIILCSLSAKDTDDQWN